MVNLMFFERIGVEAVAVFTVAKVIEMRTNNDSIRGVIVDVCGNIGAGTFCFRDGDIERYWYAQRLPQA